MRALDLVGMNLELRPRVDFRAGREQQAAAGLLRVGIDRARIDDDLAVEDDAADIAGDGVEC